MKKPPKADRYRAAGVDIEAGDRFAAALGPFARATARPGADAALGGFGGLFDLKAAGFTDPILVAGADGVGTKLKIAIETGRHDSIGQDLVAMCVNDLIVQGAEPLFFLDYFACGRLDEGVAKTVVAGIAEGCRISGCALIGGETAEMPGMYGDGDYDLAGFAVGAVERPRLLPRLTDVADGDVILGVASSGVHSNGYSLVRKIVDEAGLSYEAPAPFEDRASLGEALLTPTRIYVDIAKRLFAADGVRAIAHITGGGLTGNIPRVLPDGAQADLSLDRAQRPKVFDWLQDAGGLSDAEMELTFNCGVGLAVIVAKDAASDLYANLAATGEQVAEIGVVRFAP